jgi:hypothetical protein
MSGQQPASHTENSSSTPGKSVSVLSPVSDCQLLLTSALAPPGQIVPRPVSQSTGPAPPPHLPSRPRSTPEFDVHIGHQATPPLQLVCVPTDTMSSPCPHPLLRGICVSVLGRDILLGRVTAQESISVGAHVLHSLTYYWRHPGLHLA